MSCWWPFFENSFDQGKLQAVIGLIHSLALFRDSEA